MSRPEEALDILQSHAKGTRLKLFPKHAGDLVAYITHLEAENDNLKTENMALLERNIELCEVNDENATLRAELEKLEQIRQNLWG